MDRERRRSDNWFRGVPRPFLRLVAGLVLAGAAGWVWHDNQNEPETRPIGQNLLAEKSPAETLVKDLQSSLRTFVSPTVFDEGKWQAVKEPLRRQAEAEAKRWPGNLRLKRVSWSLNERENGWKNSEFQVVTAYGENSQLAELQIKIHAAFVPQLVNAYFQHMPIARGVYARILPEENLVPAANAIFNLPEGLVWLQTRKSDIIRGLTSSLPGLATSVLLADGGELEVEIFQSGLALLRVRRPQPPLTHLQRGLA